MSVMGEVIARNDRGAAALDRGATQYPDLLAGPLSPVRLEGAVFLRAEYHEAWAFSSMSCRATADLLHPGSERVLLFHLVASGTCWVALDDGERHWAGTGDVIVLPYGDDHRMGGVEDTEAVPVASFMPPVPWTEMPVLRHGADGPQTDVVCGYLHSLDPLFDPELRALPPVFVVHPPAGAAAEWVKANIAYALTNTTPTPAPLAARLAELLLVEVLRLHLASAPAARTGWAAALRDPVLAPALAALHRDPGHHWTVEELARTGAVSRSALGERFRQVLGCSPMRYLAQWRIHRARDLLATTDLGVASVGRRVGYEAEEAFSRAFKRSTGTSPRDWRAANRTATADGSGRRRGAGADAPAWARG